ncbi:MAG: pyridoxal-phosphate dependent enzyme [Blastocatellia bacterium]
MDYKNNILETVGHTPLVKLNKLTKGLKPLVLAKMESHNPGGSVKDRIGIAMVERAERLGELKPGGTVVEATSGNTGIGLALACAIKGYRSVFVMTDKCSQEKVRYLKALGADVVVVPAAAKHESPDHYLNVAETHCARNAERDFDLSIRQSCQPGSALSFNRPRTVGANGRAHYALVSGIGTGGTISGSRRYLKEKIRVKLLALTLMARFSKPTKKAATSPTLRRIWLKALGRM